MLALLEYFWTEADWVPGSASSTAVATATVSLSSAGSGKWHKKAYRRFPDYVSLPEDYWEIRERYIRNLISRAQTIPQQAAPQPIIPNKEEVTAPSLTINLHYLAAQRILAIEAAHQATTKSELQRLGQLIYDLTLQMRLTDDAILILLLQAAVAAACVP